MIQNTKGAGAADEGKLLFFDIPVETGDAKQLGIQLTRSMC